ncbi:hypothetical protein [uncultured Corynebacterium sp.]|uniref:hypothetical protein n=1 Tax=uncultured Corynebacterium sp. TaxID=159447 RepID=UPI0025FCD431|nr:hypothetical protein [uncultured Corynebacterium sp.]
MSTENNGNNAIKYSNPDGPGDAGRQNQHRNHNNAGPHNQHNNTASIGPNKFSLNAQQVKGLNRLGDVMIPGGDGFPSFSESGAAKGADRMLPYMYGSDRDPFKLLMTAFSYLPKPAIAGFVALVSAHKKVPEPLAGVFRLANLGIKGVVHSLYYSDLDTSRGNVHQRMGYNPTINTESYESYLSAKLGERGVETKNP